MTSRRDPDQRCGVCGVRLARVGRGHEDECGRDVPSGLGGSGGAGAVETVVNEAAKLDAPATIGGPQDPSERAA